MIFDLIAGTNGDSGPPPWTPAELFKNGEKGFWYDGSDYSTMFQNSTGTIPVTAAGQLVGLWKDKSGNNANISTSTAAASAITTTVGSSMRVSFDGVDDLLTGTSPDWGFADPATMYYGVVLPNGCGEFNGYYGSILGVNLTSPLNNLYASVNSNATAWIPITLGVPNSSFVAAITADDNDPISLTVGGLTEYSGGGVYLQGTYTTNIPAQAGNSFVIDYSQIVLVNRLLTSDEKTKLTAYITSKN